MNIIIDFFDSPPIIRESAICFYNDGYFYVCNIYFFEKFPIGAIKHISFDSIKEDFSNESKS